MVMKGKQDNNGSDALHAACLFAVFFISPHFLTNLNVFRQQFYEKQAEVAGCASSTGLAPKCA